MLRGSEVRGRQHPWLEPPQMDGVHNKGFLHVQILDFYFVTRAAFSCDGACLAMEACVVQPFVNAWFCYQADVVSIAKALEVVGEADFSSLSDVLGEFVSCFSACAADALGHGWWEADRLINVSGLFAFFKRKCFYRGGRYEKEWKA